MWAEANIEALARALADATTGRGISDYFNNNPLCGFSCYESTKWKRLKAYFLQAQKVRHNDSCVRDAIAHFLNPALFLQSREKFEECRCRLNAALALVGLYLNERSVLQIVSKAETLDEAERRASSLLSKVRERNMHKEIERYCKADLVREDFYDVVFESCKGVFERIREFANLNDKDGVALVDIVFSSERPRILVNNFQTQSEISEHRGLANLLRGLYGTFRNPAAHELKVRWKMTEEEVLEALSLISFVHRRLDIAKITCFAYNGC